MSELIEFTNNYQDHSTPDGYQFEFMCMRCGNGYESLFQRSVGGLGRIMAVGKGLVGRALGDRVEQVGWDATWLRGGTRGKGWDKALAKAALSVGQYFSQCHRYGQWVCLKVCWNDEKGLCVQCVPKLDQEIAAMQLQAQMGQLQEKIQQQDWTRNINYTDVATGLCPSCHRKSGGGKFCKFCGNPLAANEAMAKFCQNCGTKLGDANFCPECGAPTV